MHENEIFETERLFLRPTTEEDSEFMLRLLNTPKWLKYIGDRNVHTVENAQAYIRNKILPQHRRLGFSNYTVLLKSGKIKIGTCGLYDRDGLDGIDIGFAFLPEYEKQGYAFEASNKLKILAFEKFGITELSAIATKDNNESHKLLDKLGFKLSGTTKLPKDDTELLIFKTSLLKCSTRDFN